MSDADLVRLARALADPTRLRILRTIAAGGPLCCGAIGAQLPVRQATVSHHLRILSEAGLIETSRDGQFVNVSVKAGRLEAFRQGLSSVMAPPATRNGARRVRARRTA